jgi:nicotinic acid mononucleotide adenylyltransferase
VFPGSFDPLTIAHIGIAEATIEQASLDELDLAISQRTLGKDQGGHHSIEARVAAIERASRTRPWLHAVVTDAQLIADVAQGYDVVVMGADKWAQVRDPVWYGGDDGARDAAVARLPHVLVAPRPGFDTTDAEELQIEEALTHVSSTRARAGEHHLLAPEARWRVIVDGNNVIGSRADGWWRDREGATRRLVTEVQELAARTPDRFAVVLDGRPLRGLPEGVHHDVLVAYATRAGRNAADDRIVEEVEHDADPSSLLVITSDRELARRVGALGAKVRGATALSAWEHP